MRPTHRYKILNTHSTNSTVNWVTLKIKMSNTRPRKLKCSRPTNTSTCKARTETWSSKNWKSPSISWCKMKSPWVTRLIDLSSTQTRCLRIRLTCRPRSMPLTSIWETWTIRTTVYKKNSRSSFKQMIRCVETWTERTKLIISDSVLTRSLLARRLRLNTIDRSSERDHHKKYYIEKEWWEVESPSPMKSSILPECNEIRVHTIHLLVMVPEEHGDQRMRWLEIKCLSVAINMNVSNLQLKPTTEDAVDHPWEEALELDQLERKLDLHEKLVVHKNKQTESNSIRNRKTIFY